MRVVLMRHGEPDYADVTQRGFIGHGRDLAALSERGRMQAEAAARDDRLRGATLILASPYTRALQTAAVVSRVTGLPLVVETDLHEWMPDTTFQYDGPARFPALGAEFDARRGEWDETCAYRWESLSQVGARAFSAVKKYIGCADKIVAVCHGMVMRQFVYADSVPYCGILERDLFEDSIWNGWAKS